MTPIFIVAVVLEVRVGGGIASAQSVSRATGRPAGEAGRRFKRCHSHCTCAAFVAAMLAEEVVCDEQRQPFSSHQDKG